MIASTETAVQRGNTTHPPEGEKSIFADKLYLFFALAYVAQGASSQFGFIAQPTQFFFMKQAHFTAAQVSFISALLMVPWIIKPLYGFITDNFAFFGYRRKSYLIASHIMAIAGLALLSSASSTTTILGALLIIAVAMALATTVLLGLAAQTGQETGKTATYVSAQSFYYYLGNIAAVLIAGALCQSLIPLAALQTAAKLALIPVTIVGALICWLVKESKHTLRATPQQAWVAAKSLFTANGFWLVVALAFCWNFTPSLGVPLYFHQSNGLGFEQSLIGQFSAWNAAGMMIGAVIYRDVLKHIQLHRRVTLVALIWCASILSYIGLTDAVSAYGIEISRGICNTIEILCLYEIAALWCNKQNAVTMMALLLAGRNIGHDLGAIAGGSLFTYAFHSNYLPLIFVGAAIPLASLLLIPYLVRTEPS